MKDFQFLRSTSDLNITSALAPSGKSSVTKMTLREEVPTWAENARYHNTHTHTQLLEMMFRNKTDTTRTSKLTLTLQGAKNIPPVVYFPLFEAQIYFPGF